MSRIVIRSAFILTMVCANSASHAESIGVNFTATRFGGGPYPILASETAGLVPQINWNNSTPLGNGSTTDIASPVPGQLVDNTGANSGAQIVWANGNAEVNSSGGNTTPNERLYRGLVEGSFFTLPSPQLTVTVAQIPYAQYDVYAYLAGFSFDATSSVRIGSERYYYIQSSNFTTDGFIQATATSPQGAPLATYAVFRGLQSSSFNLEIIKETGNRPAIAGLQIVRVPEPGTLLLSLLAFGGYIMSPSRRGLFNNQHYTGGINRSWRMEEPLLRVTPSAS
jgi:hypothetical protein